MHRENIRYHTLYQQHKWCNGQRASSGFEFRLGQPKD